MNISFKTFSWFLFLQMEQANFLSDREFDKILELLPTDSWEKAKVYNRGRALSLVDKTVRNSEKNFEKRPAVIREIKKIILPKIIQLFKSSVKHFQYCWFRTQHVEWMRYHEGDFFKPHRDFEKYICNGMVPYVLILGLKDVGEGGQTRVEDKIFQGSAKENGVVVFQSNLMHESIVVKKGIKLCLKLEFLVFINDDFFQIESHEKGWKSFWPKKGLSLLDNYLNGCKNFHQLDSKIVLSESTSKDIHNLSLVISDPKNALPVDVDFYFPGQTKYSLHEIYSYDHFLFTDESIFYGSDHNSWDFIHENGRSSSNINFCICLWIKEKDDKEYILDMIYNKEGECVYNYNQYRFSFYLKSSDHYAKLVDIKKEMMLSFMRRFDSGRRSTNNFLPETFQSKNHSDEMKINKKLPIPSDLKHKPVKKEGLEIITEKEYCNDEEGGFDTYTFEKYKQYEIQIRYVALKN